PERIENRSLNRRVFGGCAAWREEFERIPADEHHLAVVLAQPPGPEPCDFAASAEVIEHRWRVIRNAGGQHIPFERGSGNWNAFQLPDDIAQPITATEGAVDAVPGLQEARE